MLAALDPTAWIVRTGVAYATITLALASSSAEEQIVCSDGVFTETVTVNLEGITISGQGIGKTVIAGYIVTTAGEHGLKVQELTVDSRGVAGNPINLNGEQNCHFKNVEIFSDSSYGGFRGVDIQNCLFENFYIRECGTGLAFEIEASGSANCQGNVADNLVIQRAGGKGIYMERAAGTEVPELTLYNTKIIGCADHGIEITRGYLRMKKVLITKTASGKNALFINSAGATLVEIEGYDCDIIGNLGNGINIGSVSPSKLELRNCQIYDNVGFDAITTNGVDQDLEYNWWGANPPVVGQFSGNIDYTPYLTKGKSEIHNAEFLQGGAFPSVATIADAVWDELLSGASHNLGSSAGKRLRQLSETIIREGNAQVGSTSTTLVLDSGASGIDDDYQHCYVLIWGGTGIGQIRLIHGYDQASKTVTIDPAWKTTPDGTSDFIILGFGWTHAHQVDELGIQAKADVEAECDQSVAKVATNTTNKLTDARALALDNLDQTISSTESNIITAIGLSESAIRGGDADDLKDISDQLDAVEPEAEIHIEVPQLIVPEAQNQLDGILAAGVTTLTMDDVSQFTDSGFIWIEDEKCYYAAKSGQTLTGLIRAMFGSADVLHADDTVVYQCIPHRITITTHDAGVPIDADAIPDISITNMKGDTKLASTAMTKVGGETGMYLYNLIMKSGEAVPDNWEFLFVTDILPGKTNKYNKVGTITNKAASVGDVTGGLPLSNYRVCTQDGYYDGTGAFNVWTDDQVGYVRDDNGNRIFEALIVFYNKITGVTEYQKNPPAQQETDSDGDWALHAPAGTYEVHIFKSGLRNERVERTVT